MLEARQCILRLRTQQMAEPCAAVGFEPALPNRSRTVLEKSKKWKEFPISQTAQMHGGLNTPEVEMSYSSGTFGTALLHAQTNPGKLAQIPIQPDPKAAIYCYETNALFLLYIIKERAPPFPTLGRFVVKAMD